MRQLMFVVLASVLAIPALAGTAVDVVAPIRQFIDGFNNGDVKAANAAYATGDIMIVDEFAPYRWYGANAPQGWAADYEKHAQAAGVSDSRVKDGHPTRTEIAGESAYVIVPTTYLYKEHGKPMAEKGEMTFVLQNQGGTWKISTWIWSGEEPHPAK